MAEVMKVSHQKHAYKLYYFDIKGRAEPIRLLFTFFNVHFEDIRLSMKEWPKKKSKAPMRQLPYLEVDKGKLVIAQSAAIMRYLSKSFRPGFAGNSKSDSARVDMYGEGALEIFDAFASIGRAEEGEERARALEEAMPRMELFCEVYTEHLKKNGNQYINGSLVTWADLILVFVLSAIDNMANDLLKEYKDLIRYYMRMRELDEIRDYIAENWTPTTLVPE